ncbi:MAG: hypothetical protein C6W56_08405 [Caldibacillus debilis]|nr:MAG: hypothetical protein C6W56_08405 [Caldibacillus debilis]
MQAGRLFFAKRKTIARFICHRSGDPAVETRRIANYPFERQWKEKGECVPVGNRSLYSEHLNESFKYKSKD